MRAASRIGPALLFAAVAAAAVGVRAAGEYDDYYAGRDALARGDCPAAASHLEAFLRKHPDVRERYPDFYLEVRLSIGQCRSAVVVRGVEEESAEAVALPEHPPGAQ